MSRKIPMQNYHAVVRHLFPQKIAFFEPTMIIIHFVIFLIHSPITTLEGENSIITISNLFKLCLIFSYSCNIMKNKHTVPLAQLEKEFNTSSKFGVNLETVERRILQDGPNRLPEPEKVHPLILFLKEITNWFAILLWMGAILSSTIYIIEPEGNQANLYLSLLLVVVILITGAITYLQTAKSQQIMQKFREMLPKNCKVIRQGKTTLIQAEELVRGDLIEIADGEKIPADIRIVYSDNMKVDNSSITGQTNLLLRIVESTSNSILQTKNVALFGTHCKGGRGRGIVIEIGADTYLGTVAEISQKNSGQKSPLQSELDLFVFMITGIAGTLGLLFMVLGKLVVNYSILECALFGIGIIVANVPEGILACVTISLAITAKKLADKNVLVKNLESVQTLGSTSCICSDKTGTLTMNKMTLSQIWINRKFYLSHEIEQSYVYDQPIRQLFHCAILSSAAKFQGEDQKQKGLSVQNNQIFGDASEKAFLKFVQPIEAVRAIRNSVYEPARNSEGNIVFSHFNSELKYAFGIYKSKDKKSSKQSYYLFAKGAPERIIKISSKIKEGDEQKPISSIQSQIYSANGKFAESGERVFGLAYKKLDDIQFSANKPFDWQVQKLKLNGFMFLGLAALADPPKPTVYEAIRKCRASGVKVIMVTGDQSLTAVSIAKKIGIITHKSNLDLQKQGYSEEEALLSANSLAIQGRQIESSFSQGQEIGKAQLQQWIRKPQIVFSRTTPIHKLRIVEACQRLGHIVGVTGDGVNDAPAIKQADIGISMGISGSDVTKDAADMVLLDDDFSSIIAGIEQGRKIFDNLKKTIVYLLTSNCTEIWPFIAMIILQIPLPLSNIFMLCICVGTDIYPAISLAYEEPQLDIMTRKPRNRDDRLVSIRMMVHAYGQMGTIASAAGFYTYFTVMEVYGFTPTILMGLLRTEAVVPLNSNMEADTAFNRFISFDSESNDFGNPFLPLSCKNATFAKTFPSWLNGKNSRYDLRSAYLKCCPSPNQNRYCQLFDWPSQFSKQISPITNSPIAFTTQALFYAQSGYFAAVVIVQWMNIFACKSRKFSFTVTLPNNHMFLGILSETIVLIFLLYTPSVNQIFGGRPLQFTLLGVPGTCFAMLLLLWEQARKFLMTNDILGQKQWFSKHIFW